MQVLCPTFALNIACANRERLLFGTELPLEPGEKATASESGRPGTHDAAPHIQPLRGISP